jgi:C1A family cysteine protease
MGNFIGTEQKNSFPLKIRKVKKYGWIPDIPDQRDIWTTFPKTIKQLPSVDFRKTNLLPEIYNQGSLGSSVAHAIMAAYEYDLNKGGTQGNSKGNSIQFIYYNQRYITGTTECDSGSSIRDGIKILNRLGTCTTELYPYDPNFFTDRPTDIAYQNAYNYKSIIQYRRVKLDLEDITKSISIGIPIIMGFTVYESFEHPDVARTGIMPLPKLGEKIVGSHCVLIVGHDINRKFILCRNSWGISWGQGGYFWVPFSFINVRNCSDLWIISTGSKKQLPQLAQLAQPAQLSQPEQLSQPAQLAQPEQPSQPSQKEVSIEKIPEFKKDDLSVDDNDIEEDLHAV